MPLARSGQMFRGFEARTEVDATRRYAIASVLAALFLAGLAGAAVALSDDEVTEAAEPDVIEVSFDQPEPAAAPPPPPPPPVEVKRAAPTRPTVRSDAPPPPPTKIEHVPLAKGDADAFAPTTGPAGGGDLTAMDLGGGSGGGFGGPASPTLPPPPPKPKAKPKLDNGPIALPPDAVPPRPEGGNASPDYPSDARATGLEGEVFLKIVIEADGTVGDIQVKKGDEPFVSAAVAAVKTWRYSPALVEGKPTAVYRVIKVPFRLKS